jgi:hypothetical protein
MEKYTKDPKWLKEHPLIGSPEWVKSLGKRLSLWEGGPTGDER